MKRLRVLTAAALSATILLSGCAGSSTDGKATPSAGSLSQSEIVLSYTPGAANSWLQWIAQEKGYFKAHGLTVKLQPVVTTLADLIAGMVSGSIAISCAPGSQGWLGAIQRGADLKAFGVLNTGNDYRLIIGPKAAARRSIPATGDSSAQVTALKGSGLMIGTSGLAASPRLELLRQLQSDGLVDGKDFKLVDFGTQPNMFAAFKSGKVESFVNNNGAQEFSDAVQIPFSALPSYQAKAPFAVCYTSSAMLKSHPDTLVAFAKSITDARAYLESDPNGAKETVRGLYEKAFPNLTDSALDSVFKTSQAVFSEGTDLTYTKEKFDLAINVSNALLALASQPKLTLEYSKVVDTTPFDKVK